jgi:hypothetical protein
MAGMLMWENHTKGSSTFDVVTSEVPIAIHEKGGSLA